jgi:hypothetical protein
LGIIPQYGFETCMWIVVHDEVMSYACGLLSNNSIQEIRNLGVHAGGIRELENSSQEIQLYKGYEQLDEPLPSPVFFFKEGFEEYLVMMFLFSITVFYLHLVCFSFNTISLKRAC